jgi:hypothetical protein
MFNPLDMVQAAGGPEMQAMARQFGLTVDQTQRAFEALMPALTLGLQRGAGLDPTGLARMFTMPDMARAAAPQGLDALGQMFGSAQLMQAVLQQASATSGVQSQVLRQMLPMMAGAVVASIVHVVLNQPQAEPARQTAPAPSTATAPMAFVTLWTDMARAFMTPPSAAPAPAASRPAPPPPNRPQMQAPRPPQPEVGGDTGSDMLSQMIRTGAEVQEQNLQAMQQLFEALWPGAKPAASASDPNAGPSPSQSPGSREPRPAPRGRRGRPGEGA